MVSRSAYVATFITLKCKGCGIDFVVPIKQRNMKYHNRSCASSNQFKDEDVNKRLRSSLKIGAKKAKRTRAVNKGKVIKCLDCQQECSTIGEFNELDGKFARIIYHVLQTRLSDYDQHPAIQKTMGPLIRRDNLAYLKHASKNSR